MEARSICVSAILYKDLDSEIGHFVNWKMQQPCSLNEQIPCPVHELSSKVRYFLQMGLDHYFEMFCSIICLTL